MEIIAFNQSTIWVKIHEQISEETLNFKVSEPVVMTQVVDSRKAKFKVPLSHKVYWQSDPT